MGLDKLSPINRPLTLAEVARACRVPKARLDRLVKRHGLAPTFWAGAVRLYGPEQPLFDKTWKLPDIEKV